MVQWKLHGVGRKEVGSWPPAPYCGVGGMFVVQMPRASIFPSLKMGVIIPTFGQGLLMCIRFLLGMVKTFKIRLW